GGGADDGVAAGAHAALAGVGLGAGVAVVAGGAVGLGRVGPGGGAGLRAVRRGAVVRRRSSTRDRAGPDGVVGGVVPAAGADDGVAARAHAALAGVGLGAEIAVVAGGAVGLETDVRAGGAGPRAVLRRVALIRRWSTLDRRGLEGVGGTLVAAPVAGLSHVA